MYAIHKNIINLFGAYTSPSFGAIKPALVRLEKSNLITSSKIMSEGGKLSIFYSITAEGKKKLKKIILEPFSGNPVQFFSDARIKLSCLEILKNEEKTELLNEVMTKALLHKIKAEKLVNNEYIDITIYEKVVLKNFIQECNNFVTFVEKIGKI